MAKRGYGLQLYSLRDEASRDFVGTVRMAAEMGYKGVEFAGYGGLAPAEMKRLLAECGLKAYGTHFGKLPKTDEELAREIEMNTALENPYLVCPFMPIKTREDTMRLADLMNDCAKRLSPYGLKLGYHNHSHEFVKDGDEYLLDILFANTDPAVFAEIDVFWVAYAGVDPLEYIAKYPGRQPLMHLKELGSDGKANVEIGTGVIDFDHIIDEGVKLGIRHFIVEQEEYTCPPPESCRRSLEGLEALGKEA